MKKSLIIIAAAAVLASCSNEVLRDDFNNNAEKQAPVSFDTFVQKAVNTRATSENNGLASSNALEAYHTSFVVNGFKTVGSTTSQVFEDQKVEYKSSAWAYTPVRYWDRAASSYSFYAAAPYSTNWEFSNNGYKYADYSLTGVSLAPATSVSASQIFASGDVDLMVSNDIDSYTAFQTDAAEAVHFYFNHILARLNISVKVGDALASSDCKLLELKVYNMKCSGTFDESLASADATGTSARWNTASGDALTSGVGYANASGDALSTSDKYYYQALCIPQEVEYASGDAAKIDGSSFDDDSAPYIMVKYSLNGDTYKYYYNLADVFNGTTSDDIEFCEGWMNTLHILISPAEIKFDADVFDWNTKQNKDFTINQ